MPTTAEKTLTINTASATSVGTSSSWIPLDIHQTPFNVGFGVVKRGGGDITFRVEHTFDDIFDSSVTPDAFTHEDVSAANDSIDGNYAFGLRACRLTVVSASGSVQVAFKVVQVGNIY